MSGRVEIHMGARRTGRTAAATTIAALRLVDIARGLGFRSAGIEQSRVRGSKSRYVLAVDNLGRSWSIRVSTHRAPADTKTHHFDLVARGGAIDVSGASDFLARVAAGDERWWDHEPTGRQVSHRQRQHWGRR